jgi:hypothetical protein
VHAGHRDPLLEGGEFGMFAERVFIDSEGLAPLALRLEHLPSGEHFLNFGGDFNMLSSQRGRRNADLLRRGATSRNQEAGENSPMR